MKTNNILLALFCLLLIANTSAQDITFRWAKSISGPDYQYGQSVAINDKGEVYTTGAFRGTADFDPGSDTFNLTATPPIFNPDIYIQKLDADGNLLWAKRIGNSKIDFISTIKLDSNGSVFVCGHFSDTVDFDPGPSVYNLVANNNVDAFILKLDSNGYFKWAKSVGRSGGVYVQSLEIDANGNIYTAGYFLDTADFDPGIGVYNLVSSGSLDIYVLKLDADGNYIWAKGLGSMGNDIANSITVDTWGNVYTTGRFHLTVDFNPGLGVNNLTANGKSDIFILKLDSNGNYVWAKSMGAGENDVGYSIVTDKKSNVYTTGAFLGTADFDPGIGVRNMTAAGSRDIFIQKLDSNGNFKWSNRMGGLESDEGSSITKDINGNIYSTGVFRGTVDFRSGPGVLNFKGSSTGDMYIQKLKPNGGFMWAKHFNGPEAEWGRSIVTDAYQNIYVTGNFEDTVDFNPQNGVFSLNSAGLQDAFILKLSQCKGAKRTEQAAACYSYTWAQTGLTYTASGSYKDTITNPIGCDTIVTLNLTIFQRTNSIDTVFACDSFTWRNGLTYIFDNMTAKDTLVNSKGCDSIISLYLIIAYTSSSFSSISACDQYTWPHNGQTYSSSGTFIDTISNTSGCDSIISLELIIYPPTSFVQTESTCSSFTWLQTGQTYTTSGIYKDTIPNTNGCDSIISLDLTIDTVDISVSNSTDSLYSNDETASYQWLNCGNGYAVIQDATNRGYKPQATGTYAVELSNGSCLDTSNCFFILITGIEEPATETSLIRFYPNPASNSFTLDLSESIDYGKFLRLFDLEGRLVLEKQIVNQRQQIDISGLSKGVYLSRYGHLIKKLVIQ